MSKIEKITSYRVDGNVFETKEDAERYLVKKEIDSVRSDPKYRKTEFYNTSYYEHYVYKGASHEFRECVGTFTNLEDALNNMSLHRNQVGSEGSGYIMLVRLQEADSSQGLVVIKRTLVIDVR
jgi:hypothetical protein